MPTPPVQRKLWLVGGRLLAACVMSCGYHWWRPIPEPDEADAEALVALAEQWHPADGQFRPIPEAEWPPEVLRLKPVGDLRATRRGLFIPCGSRFVEEWGLFVLPPASPFQPRSGGKPGVTPLSSQQPARRRPASPSRPAGRAGGGLGEVERRGPRRPPSPSGMTPHDPVRPPPVEVGVVVRSGSADLSPGLLAEVQAVLNDMAGELPD